SVASALNAMWKYSESGRRVTTTLEPASVPVAEVALDDIPVGSLNEAEAKTLFARFGVPSVRERVVTNAEEAKTAAREFGGKVVL
ncbi:acetate--CoA ligase family protein, partial [Salmonella sp. 6412]|uniref:acetate--CoA ligase family protein n=1 Tax=Salmonella sp. 6412 TaxID=3159581 RepID=UPI00397864AD